MFGFLVAAVTSVTGGVVSGAGKALAAGGNGRDVFSGVGNMLDAFGNDIVSLGGHSAEASRESAGTLSLGAPSMPDFKAILSGVSLPGFGREKGGQELGVAVGTDIHNVEVAAVALPVGVIDCNQNDICVPAGLKNVSKAVGAGMGSSFG